MANHPGHPLPDWCPLPSVFGMENRNRTHQSISQAARETARIHSDGTVPVRQPKSLDAGSRGPEYIHWFWDSFLLEVVVMAVIFGVFSLPCTAAWTLLGVGACRVMSKPRHMLIFNLAMAAPLVVSVIPAIGATWRSLPF